MVSTLPLLLLFTRADGDTVLLLSITRLCEILYVNKGTLNTNHGVNGNTSAYVWGCVPTMLQGNLYRKDRGRTAKEKEIGPSFLAC